MCCNETENASERRPVVLFVWGSTDLDAQDSEQAAHVIASASGFRITGLVARSVSPLLWVVDRGDYGARTPVASERDYFAVWELYDPIPTVDTMSHLDPRPPAITAQSAPVVVSDLEASGVALPQR